MKNFHEWKEENNQLQVIKANISMEGNRMMIQTSNGSFDLLLTPQQVADLTEKMGGMQVAQNPNNAPAAAYQAVS